MFLEIFPFEKFMQVINGTVVYNLKYFPTI